MKDAKQKVAFFDIDGTLFRWSLFIEYVDLMFEKGVFPQSQRRQIDKKLIAWRARKASYEEYLSELVRVFDENIAGVPVKLFQDIVKEALEGKKERVYVFTRDFIKELKRQGYFVVAISRSAKMALDLFTEIYDFDKVYGVMFEIVDDKFSGKVLNKDIIFDKGKVVQRVLEKENLSLEGSVAVGDTESDIAMLELVERPIAFNPNKRLYEHAKAKGWEIVVERKDVIYKIK